MKNTKLMTAFMAGTMIAGSIMPVFASDELDLDMNFAGTGETSVTYDSAPKLDKSDFYSVRIPKKIDMGNKKTATYEVGVAGHMTECSVTITPASSFEMTHTTDSSKKTTATVTQEDTDWAPTELEGTYTVTTETVDGKETHKYSIDSNKAVMHTGTISAEGLTDGTWQGTLTFTIGIE